MERRIVNPWTWQDQLGFVQANAISGAQRMLICSGQGAVDADGAPVHVGDMEAQISQALDNLEQVLSQAGFELSDVVRLNMFTTDVDQFFQSYQVMVDRLATAGCRQASTLLGVSRLAYPEMMIELEATAVQ